MDKNTQQSAKETTEENLARHIAELAEQQENARPIRFNGSGGFAPGPIKPTKPQLLKEGKSYQQFGSLAPRPQPRQEMNFPPTWRQSQEPKATPDLVTAEETLNQEADPIGAGLPNGLTELARHIVQDAQAAAAEPRPEEQATNQNTEEIQSSYATLRKNLIDPKKALQKPQAALTMNGKTCFTLGEIFVISGAAKARKSFLLQIFAAALAQQNGKFGVFGDCLAGGLPSNKKNVLIIDTEQSEYHCARSLKRSQMLCNELDAENIHYAHAVGKTPAELLTMLEAAAQLFPNLGAIIIDNGGDLMEAGENDEKEAAFIANGLNSLAQAHQIAVGLVVHNARTTGSGDLNGQLGSKLARKCAFHIVVSKVPKTATPTSTTEIKRCRWQDPEPFTFEIQADELGTPAWLPYIAPKSETAQRREAEFAEINQVRKAAGRGRPKLLDPAEYSEEMHQAAWNLVWSHPTAASAESLTKAQIIPILTNSWRKANKGESEFGEKRAEEFLSHAIGEGYTQQNAKGRYIKPTEEEE